MEQFPSNSRSRAEQPPKPNKTIEDLEKLKLEPVVTGKVVKRKKPLGRRILSTFFSGDSNSVFGYLLNDVLVPALKETAIHIVQEGIEKAVYGEVRSARRTSHRGTGSIVPRTHISYNQPSTIVRSSSPTAPPPRRAVTQASAFDVGEIVLDSKIACDVVLEKLNETIEEYGAVTVANLNDLLQQTSAYTDHKWGWTDLQTATVRRITEGYLLILPEPEDLR